MSSSCGAACGIGAQRDRLYAAVRELVRSGDSQRAPDSAAIASIASSLDDVLPARVVAASPTDSDDAPSIHVIATMDATSWHEVRAGVRAEWPHSRTETHLRLLFSPRGPFVTMQECVLTASVDGDGAWLEETLCDGVRDTRLAPFVKAAQGVLRRERHAVLDASLLAERVAGQRLFTALFEPTPPGTVRGTWVARTR